MNNRTELFVQGVNLFGTMAGKIMHQEPFAGQFGESRTGETEMPDWGEEEVSNALKVC